MVKRGCRAAPCHSPEELRRRLREPGLSLEEIDRLLAHEARARQRA